MMDQLVKWAIKLIKFDVKFQICPSIKVQVLVDFIIECIILKESTKKSKLVKEDLSKADGSKE